MANQWLRRKGTAIDRFPMRYFCVSRATPEKSGGIMRGRLFLPVAVLAMVPLAAPLLATSHPLAALLVRSFFSRLCHQNPARSFLIEGSPVAVCVRCLGIYLGTATGLLLRPQRATAARWLTIAAFMNGLDVSTGMLGWHGNWPLARFLLGLLLGTAAGAILFLPEIPPGNGCRCAAGSRIRPVDHPSFTDGQLHPPEHGPAVKRRVG
ncbi:MAG: DUF2085 domain-containing protein [Acidobacteriaceae bacterium]